MKSSEPTEQWPIWRWTRLYVMLAVAATVAILLFAYWAGQGTPRREATRLNYIQLRVLRQARDRLVEYLANLEYSVGQLAQQPTIIEPRSLTPDDRVLDQSLGRLDWEGMVLRRYGLSGEVLSEFTLSGPRGPRLSADQMKELLTWAGVQKNSIKTRFDLIELSGRSDAVSKDFVRFTSTVVKTTPEGKKEPAGILCLWLPSSFLLGTFLQQTHLLPESYTFVISSANEPTEDSGSTLLWHSAEPEWARSTGPEANAFLAALHLGKSSIDSGERDSILDLPRRDGNERKEVVAVVPVVFGTRRWAIGLSTPFDVAVEFSAAQRNFMILLCLLTFGILVVGILLLAFQRTRLLDQARSQQRIQLQEFEHDYAQLFEENPAGMFVFDQSGTLVDCNNSAERLVGLSRQEMLGLTVNGLFEESSITTLWESLRERGHLHGRDKQLVRRHDHTSILVEISGRLINDKFVLMAQNVEQRRDLEQQIARFKRMDSIGALTSTIAHDFNNLLGQIQILVSNVRSELPASSPIEGDVLAIEKKVDDASQLVVNLLSMRDEVVSRDRVWLEPILRSFAADQPLVLPDRINFRFEIRGELPPVWISPVALRRVLDNLVHNACDAMPYGGSLLLRAMPRRIDPTQESDQLPIGNYAAIEITDTGTGMSREVQEAIFDPFFSTKGQGKGVGLGLWTVYRIVRRVGGWIQVNSRLGRGTQFTILLPQSQPRDSEHSSRSLPALGYDTSPDSASSR